MWTTFIEEPYELRSECNAAPADSAEPSTALPPADLHAILLTALAPFRDARDAVIKAIEERLAQLRFSPGPA